MFWRKTRKMQRCLRRLGERADYQGTRLDGIEDALNDLTKLIAEKHQLKLRQPMFYNSLERLDSQTVTNYVKVGQNGSEGT